MAHRIDADTRAHLESIKGSPGLHELPVAEARRTLDEVLVGAGAPKRPIRESRDLQISAEDGEFNARVYWPQAAQEDSLPALIWFHGGGWTIGSMASIDSVCRYLCHEAHAVVMNVDYRLAPEYKFPVPVEDAYTAYCWAAEAASSLGIDRQRLVLAGTSAGGSLTITCCLLAAIRGGPAARLQIPIYPCFTLQEDHGYESRQRFGGGEFGLSTAEIDWLFANYLRSAEDANDLRASPALHHDFSGFPEALIVTAGLDPLLDDGIDYYQRLLKAGVAAEHVCFESTIHGFVEIPASIRKGLEALDLIVARVKQLQPSMTLPKAT